jgi:hypothetical protein
LKVAIITDAHIDPLYEPYGVADCDEPTCCRVGQKPANNFFSKPKIDESQLKKSFVDNNGQIMLNLTAAQTNIGKQNLSKKFKKREPEPAGYWGDYRNCDTPKWAFDDVIDNLKESHKVSLGFDNLTHATLKPYLSTYV